MKNMKHNYIEYMGTLKTIWNFIFNSKTICGKQWIEETMTEKYGENWFEEMIEGLKDSSVRKSIADELDKTDYCNSCHKDVPKGFCNSFNCRYSKT